MVIEQRTSILAELEPRLRVELVARGLLDQYPTETFADWPGVFAARRNAALMPHERETPSSVKGRHLPAHHEPAVGRAERAMLAGIGGKLVHREGKDLYGFMRQPHVGAFDQTVVYVGGAFSSAGEMQTTT
jgi:hypothetical protein